MSANNTKPITVSEAIRASGLRLRTIAQACVCTESAISRYAAGHRTPDLKMADTLGKILGYDVIVVEGRAMFKRSGK